VVFARFWARSTLGREPALIPIRATFEKVSKSPAKSGILALHDLQADWRVVRVSADAGMGHTAPRRCSKHGRKQEKRSENDN
jgi:hypothetical protein